MPHIAIDPTHPTTAAHAIAMAMADATVESTSPHMAHQWAAMGHEAAAICWDCAAGAPEAMASAMGATYFTVEASRHTSGPLRAMTDTDVLSAPSMDAATIAAAHRRIAAEHRAAATAPVPEPTPVAWPHPGDPCYDCGSTIPGHHTALCDFAPEDAVRDLPSHPDTQHWTGEAPTN